GKHRGRERAERLAVLHLEVEGLLHRRRARVAQDRARTERARAELHAALEPAERLAFGERPRAGVDHALVVERPENRPGLGETLLAVLEREFGSDVTALH